MIDSRVDFQQDMSVTGSFGTGVLVGGEGGAQLTLRSGSEIGFGCGTGVSVGRGSIAVARNDTWIHDNERYGLFTSDSGRIQVRGDTIAENNLWGGMGIRLGGTGLITEQAVLKMNWDHPDPDNRFFAWRSGVHAWMGSILLISGPDPDSGLGPTIEDNTGPGVLVDLNSTLYIHNVTVQDNSDGGVSVLHQSAAEFDEAVTATANTGGDLGCDSESLVYGDLSGVGINNCSGSQQGGGQGP